LREQRKLTPGAGAERPASMISTSTESRGSANNNPLSLPSLKGRGEETRGPKTASKDKTMGA
jgi:hypothetical protein